MPDRSHHLTTNDYPDGVTNRNAWVVARRAGSSGRAEALDPFRPVAFFAEDERSSSGEIVPVATIFLTNRECPWRCLMCDLWQHTLSATVPAGAITAQVDFALRELAPHRARHVKIYNSGSFFDRRAIPTVDYEPVAARLSDFERVIVESHPALVGDDCWRWRDLLRGQLEVAMGLETVHPTVGPRLNKGMTPDSFARAADALRRREVALRVFVMVKLPWMSEDEALEWARRSLDFAFDCGATAASLVPTRAGNGALDELQKRGEFSPPRLRTLEAAAAYGVGLGRGRVFADLWDLEKTASCASCFAARASRLSEMNLRQRVAGRVSCGACDETSG